MSDQLTVYVKWHEDTLRMFKEYKISIDLNESVGRQLPASTTVDQLSQKITGLWESLYEDAYQEQAQMQVDSVTLAANPDKELPFEDSLGQHIRSGDAVVAHAVFLTESMMQNSTEFRKMREEAIKNLRKELRFDLNDRVLCYCGPRWLSGHIVGTAVDNDGELLPYLVKTDPLPGLESRTISVPHDSNMVCVQEVCFDRTSEMHLIQAAAPLAPASKRPALRFGLQEKVVCRIRNAADGLEKWLPGTVTAIWPTLHGPREWEIDGVSGEYADVVPYKIDFEKGGWTYCHADNHTLIRRQGMEPQTRVKGISKRMESRKLAGGIKECIDHVTEKRKQVLDSDSEDDD
mmetsp:Transcript_2497/g.2702  ORF Transcript_2497/g.2702 Transcript_2497/m.2702 type:complete len:347 (+) Transcript_2497:59-1099(+)